MDKDIWNMTLALEQARKAYQMQEVPVGSIIISKHGEVLSFSHNTKERDSNPCAHAEINAIIESSKRIKNWRLSGCTLYSTLEPCSMCLSAMIHARIDRLVFGAYDSKGGAISLGYNLYNDLRLNHRFDITGGIKHYECSKIISRFFRENRSFYSKPSF